MAVAGVEGTLVVCRLLLLLLLLMMMLRLVALLSRTGVVVVLRLSAVRGHGEVGRVFHGAAEAARRAATRGVGRLEPKEEIGVRGADLMVEVSGIFGQRRRHLT